MKILLLQKSLAEHENEVVYSSAFGLFEYEIEEVFAGTYSGDRIRVAHMIVLNNR